MFAPKNAVRAPVQQSPGLRSLEILQALLRLSKITKGERKESQVCRVIRKEFESLRNYDLSKSLKAYRLVHSFCAGKGNDGDLRTVHPKIRATREESTLSHQYCETSDHY